MSQEFNVLALLKGDESYIYVYDDASKRALIDAFQADASNVELSLNWFDAAVLKEKANEQIGTEPATNPRF